MHIEPQGKKHVSKMSPPLNFQIEFNLSAKMHPRITASNLNQVSNIMLLSHLEWVLLTNLGTLLKLTSAETYFNSEAEMFV